MKNVERERIMRDYLFNAKDAKDLWCFAGVFGGDRKGRKGVDGNRLRFVIAKVATRIESPGSSLWVLYRWCPVENRSI
jgi:hypothetical protein